VLLFFWPLASVAFAAAFGYLIRASPCSPHIALSIAMSDALSVARQRLFDDAVSFTGPVALSVTIHRCFILGFHSLCALPSLWPFSACLCFNIICRHIHDAISFARPATFHVVVSAGAMLCFILSVGFVSILRTELAIPRYCLLH
jgi:hypothetical protein